MRSFDLGMCVWFVVRAILTMVVEYSLTCELELHIGMYV